MESLSGIVREALYVRKMDTTAPAGRISFVSDTIEILSGYKPDDFYSDSNLWSSILHPADRNRVVKESADFLSKTHSRKSEERICLIYRIKHKKTGKYQWFEDIMVPQFDSAGRKVGVGGSIVDITERKKREDSARDSEDRFRSIFENASIGIYRTTPDGRVLIANPSMARILGFKNVDELLACNLEEHYLSDLPRSRFRELVESGGYVSGLESRHIRKNGSEYWIRENSTAVYGKDGKVAYYEGTVEDVSDRKKAEQALTQERTLLKTLIEILPSAIFVKDVEYKKFLVNQVHLRDIVDQLGRSEFGVETAILGKNDFEVYPRKMAEEYFQDDQKVIKDGQTILDREESRITHDGRKKWVSISKIPLRDKSGKIVGLLGIISDITSRKHADDQRDQERTLLRTLIDHLPSSIYVKDTKYRKILVNSAHLSAVRQHLKSMGLSGDKRVLGKTDFGVYPLEVAERFFLEDRTVLESGKVILDREDFRVDPEGKKRWTLVSKIPLEDDYGKVSGFVGIETDITHQKITEEALRVSEAELRSLFASMKDDVIVMDRDGSFLKVTPSDPKFLDRSKSVFAGKSIHEIMDVDQAELFLHLIRKTLDTHEPQNAEYKLVNGETEAWFNATLSQMDENRVLVVSRDITEHRQAEEALRKSERTLNQINNSIDDTIYSIDGQTAEFTYLSPAFKRKFGYSMEDIREMGGRWSFLKKVLQPPDSHGADPIINHLRQTIVRQVPIWENWWRCKDGKLVFLEDKSVPVYDGNNLVRIDGVLRDITAWKISEDTKQREQILLRTLIDNIPYAVYVKDKEGRKVISNPADVRNMGLSTEAEVLGKTDYDVYPKEIADNFFADDQEVIRNRRPVLNREEFLYDREGKKQWLLTSKIPLLDETGKLVGIVGMGADITDRKAIEEALRKSEAELRTVFESMRDMILVLDRDGRILRASPTDNSLLYMPASELVGKTICEVFPAEKADYFLTIIHKTLKTTETQNVEYSLTIQGVEKWRSAAVSSLTKDAVLWVARDITEQKLMEKEIKESERKYRELVENALVGVYRMTMSGRIIYANKAMADMLEYGSPQELMAVKASALYRNENERDEFMRRLRNYGKTDKSNEVEFVTKDGNVRNVLLSASLDGEVISGMAKDITDIRKLEHDFVQTQKLEGLGNIAAGVAHDFNNILGVILGYADLLSQSAFEPKRFERGTLAIVKSAERGKSLVKQLLTFARKTETTFGPVRVNEVVSEIEKLLAETFPKTIVIKTILKEDLPVISGDATQIHQVLLNICVNARDAMSKGGGLVISTDLVQMKSVALKFPEASSISYVRVALEDNGVGMSEETRRRIFEPFFTTKEVGKGTGLGLSVVYGIMRSHRGFVDVTSEPSRGTVFVLYFPVLDEFARETDVEERAEEEISGGTDTILIIEDEEMLRDLLRAMLESKGYKVLAARDGQEGLQLFRKKKDQIAVVLSDLGLPKLSGEEVVTYIRQASPQAKVIIASGFIDPEIRAGLEAAGVKAFIQKPYYTQEVLKAVRNAIDETKT